jgi:F420H(2)-dependent quinone reductase
VHNFSLAYRYFVVRRYRDFVDTSINQIVEAVIRAGVGGPCYLGVGLVIIETTGRRSGIARSVPVLANRIGETLVVSTVRSKSQWIKNLQADPNPHVVVNRKSRSVSVKSRSIGSWTVLRLHLQDEPVLT